MFRYLKSPFFQNFFLTSFGHTISIICINSDLKNSYYPEKVETLIKNLRAQKNISLTSKNDQYGLFEPRIG